MSDDSPPADLGGGLGRVSGMTDRIEVLGVSMRPYGAPPSAAVHMGSAGQREGSDTLWMTAVVDVETISCSICLANAHKIQIYKICRKISIIHTIVIVLQWLNFLGMY